jgi:tetratricopeptide (TPR) repeat protein
MEIADYWLDEIHPVRSDLLEVLSDHYSRLEMHEEMIRFMKDALNISVKFWGPGAEQTGIKEYQLADRYLRAGMKKQATEVFLKAKENMLHNKTKTNKLGLANVKLAAIFLSDLDYQKALQHAKDSITHFEDYERKIKSLGIYNEPYKIKAY